MKTNVLVSLGTAVASWIQTVASGPVLKAERAESAADFYNTPAQFSVPLRKSPYTPVEGAPPTLSMLHSKLRRPDDSHGSSAPPPPEAALRNVKDMYFTVDITVGQETIAVHVDTGSSDTWIVPSNFSCVRENPFGFDYINVPEASCGFGKLFSGNLSQGLREDSPLMITYGDGTFARGFFGYEDVTIGGLTAKHQQVGLANQTYWSSDGIASGILGLAYPLMTSVDDESLRYDPVFWTIFKQNLTRPMFSLTLSRDQKTAEGSHNESSSSKSMLAFGGVPVVDYNQSSWSSAPIQPQQSLHEWDFIKTKDRGMYVIRPDAFVAEIYNETTKRIEVNTTVGDFPVVIDAGASLSYLPANMVKPIFQMFDPPAQWYGRGAGNFAPCNATLPKVGVRFGTQTYYFSPKDLLKQTVRDRETGTLCLVGLYDAEVGPYILGMSFLNNVVSVFDIGNNEVRFAERTPY